VPRPNRNGCAKEGVRERVAGTETIPHCLAPVIDGGRGLQDPTGVAVRQSNGFDGNRPAHRRPPRLNVGVSLTGTGDDPWLPQGDLLMVSMVNGPDTQSTQIQPTTRNGLAALAWAGSRQGSLPGAPTDPYVRN